MLPSLILCIDDDKLMLKLVRNFLERFGYSNILTAASGTDGLKMAALHEIDLAILDYNMPDMNGAIVATGIRRLRPNALIIMLSGEDIPEQIKTLADAFVPKENFYRELVPTLTMLGAAAG